MDIAATRIRNHKLDRANLRMPEDAVAGLGAVQAQEYAAARWALGLRTRNTTDAGVARACDEGRILRIHILRPTSTGCRQPARANRKSCLRCGCSPSTTSN